jgi:superfamily II DNA or RNA helicase
MSGLLSVGHPRPTPSPSKAASSQASATPRPLFDHQVPAVADAVAGLARTTRGQVIMACGTGKTVVAQRIAETLAGTDTDTVLVLFPNLGLLAQNARAWATYREVGFAALALCSEQQVGRGKARDSDEIQLDTAEFGIPNTTDPDVLADWLRSTTGRRMVFATYQSSDKLAAMHTAHPELGKWSMIVCDEAHRTAGPGWSATGLFATVLDDTRVPAQRRLFLTATPRLHRLTRGKAAEDVVSMDDDALFGPRLHELSFAAAAEKGVLARYRLVVIGVDDAAINTLIRSNTRLTGLHDLDAKKAATLVAVNRAAKQYGLHRILAYHNTIQHSREFAAHLTLVEAVLPHEHKPVGPLGVRHVDGSMAPAEREDALTALTGTDDTGGAWTVVSNVKCLAEGVDVPTLDGIVVCEPRSSAVDVVQMVGRAIRPNTARDEPSVILLPVYLAPGEDPAQVVSRSDFSGVVQTMTAMRDMDQTLDAYFADAAEPWEVTYQKVTAHTAVSNRLPSPDDNDPDTARLGRWCVRQAVAVDLDTTTPSGKRRLTGPQTAKVLTLPGFAEIDTTDVDWTGRKPRKSTGRPPIDFDFPDGVGEDVAAQLAEAIHLHVVGALTDGYETGVAHLQSYIAAEGNANVPLKFVTDDGFRLGGWVDNRRHDRRNGRLSTARIAELSTLGMVWDPLDVAYRTGVNHFRSYIAAEGHANVPLKFVTDDGFTLGAWVATRRRERRAGTLSTARIAELNALGMVWDPHDAGYQIGVNHLRSYIAAEGNANVPVNHVADDGFRLGGWAASRREERRTETLSAKRIDELSALGVVWSSSREANYLTGVNHFRSYIAAEGHANVPLKFVTDDGFTLGAWVRSRRKDRTIRRLSAAKAAELNKLGMVWNPRAE